MGIRIKRVGVLGAGVMGQGIAAHLANAGIPSYLFDVAPQELADAEAAAGLTLEDRKVRNRISDAGVIAMKRAKPALLYQADLAPLVTACNYEDDLDRLGECDWIVDVVVERAHDDRCREPLAAARRVDRFHDVAVGRGRVPTLVEVEAVRRHADQGSVTMDPVLAAPLPGALQLRSTPWVPAVEDADAVRSVGPASGSIEIAPTLTST